MKDQTREEKSSSAARIQNAKTNIVLFAERRYRWLSNRQIHRDIMQRYLIMKLYAKNIVTSKKN